MQDRIAPRSITAKQVGAGPGTHDWQHEKKVLTCEGAARFGVYPNGPWGSWVTKADGFVSGETECGDEKIFGEDPAPGQTKYCYCRKDVATEARPIVWCADEKQKCNCPANSYMYFGVGETWSIPKLSTGKNEDCRRETFDRPEFGAAKNLICGCCENCKAPPEGVDLLPEPVAQVGNVGSGFCGIRQALLCSESKKLEGKVYRLAPLRGWSVKFCCGLSEAVVLQYVLV